MPVSFSLRSDPIVRNIRRNVILRHDVLHSALILLDVVPIVPPAVVHPFRVCVIEIPLRLRRQPRATVLTIPISTIVVPVVVTSRVVVITIAVIVAVTVCVAVRGNPVIRHVRWNVVVLHDRLHLALILRNVVPIVLPRVFHPLVVRFLELVLVCPESRPYWHSAGSANAAISATICRTLFM